MVMVRGCGGSTKTPSSGAHDSVTEPEKGNGSQIEVRSENEILGLISSRARKEALRSI